MKKRLLLLLLLPLAAQADPHFGPNFGLYLSLAALWYLVGLPLLVAQLVSWGLQLIKRRKMNVGAARIAAVLATWLGVYLVFNGSMGAPGNGIMSAEGGTYLAAFAALGAVTVGLAASKQ